MGRRIKAAKVHLQLRIKRQLDNLKLVPEESYGAVIERMIHAYKLMQRKAEKKEKGKAHGN